VTLKICTFGKTRKFDPKFGVPGQILASIEPKFGPINGLYRARNPRARPIPAFWRPINDPIISHI